MDEFSEYFQFCESNENRIHEEGDKHDLPPHWCGNRTGQIEKKEMFAKLAGILDFHKSTENQELFQFGVQDDLLDGENEERLGLQR